MLPECELAVDPLRKRLEPFLLQPLDLVPGERLEYDVRERRASPQREAFAEGGGCSLRLVRTS